MAATSSIKIEKTFPYRGATRHFSNRYHFNTGEPPDNTHWQALANAVVAAEKLIYSSRVTIVAAIAYSAGSDLPLFSYSYSTAGTFVPSGSDIACPGDCAKVSVWLTTARSVKNHPVFLFSYWHDVYAQSTALSDQVSPNQRSLYHNYQQAWVTGFSDGSTVFHRAGPRGASAIDYKAPVPDYITHRDFPS